MRFLPLVALFGCSLPQSLWAQDSFSVLQRINEASRTHSYSGTFVYDRPGNLTAHNIWHLVAPDGTLRERVQQIDGADQEVVRRDGRVECASSALADHLVGSQMWPEVVLDAQQILQWYDIVDKGVSRVAGRSADVLVLKPRDSYRYGFELHLDQETGLPIKSLLFDERGQLLERVQFTELEIEPPEPNDLNSSADCQAVQLAETETADTSLWTATWLPPGFTLGAITRRPSPVTQEPVDSLAFADGLSHFSVFLEPLHGAQVEPLQAQLGSTVAVSRRLATAGGDVMVTVVGEIPLGAAERVALSVREKAAVAQ